MFKTKYVSWILLVIIALSAVIIVVPVVVAEPDAGTLALFDAVDGDHNVTWQTGSEPGSYPFFDVELKLTNVTQCYSVAFSLHWDTTYLNYSSSSFVGNFLGPTAIPFTSAVNYTGGFINEWSLGMFDTTQWQTITDPSWGLVCTLTFEFVGSSPAIGVPIDTLIEVYHKVPPPIPSQKSYWNQYTGGAPIEHIFLVRKDCTFYYFAAWGTVSSPTANFAWSPTLIYAGSVVTFDGSAPAYSTNGQDGDGAAPITQWWWDFGDGTPVYMTTSGVETHTYASAGGYTVKLYVVAPGVPPNIHPSYVATSTTTSKPLSVVALAFTGIDVYTESFRWPWYYDCETGSGPNQNADCFRPQENVDLYAFVYYNSDPVQNKLVKFYIVGPDNVYGQFEFARTAYSSNGSVWNGTEWIPMADGVAWIPFRIPWPCEYAQERVFGEWTVTVQVSLPDVKPGEEIIYEDILHFKVCWGVTIIGLRTLDEYGYEESQFKKCETITVEVDLTSCYLESDRDAVVAVTIYDDVGTVIAASIWMVENIPGEETYCNPVTTTVSVDLHIPKWAYLGPHAMVYANAFTELPWLTATAEPWCPEVSASIILVQTP